MAIVIDDIILNAIDNTIALASFIVSFIGGVVIPIAQKAIDIVTWYVDFLNNAFPWDRPAKLLALFLIYVLTTVLLLGLFGGDGIRGNDGSVDRQPISIGSDIVVKSVDARGTMLVNESAGTGGGIVITPSTSVSTSSTSTSSTTSTIIDSPPQFDENFTAPMFDNCTDGKPAGGWRHYAGVEDPWLDPIAGGGCWPYHCFDNAQQEDTEEGVDCGNECAACWCVSDDQCPSNLCVVGTSLSQWGDFCAYRCAIDGTYPPYTLGSRDITVDVICVSQYNPITGPRFSTTDLGSPYWSQYTNSTERI